ncbi:hypothetical protein FAK_15050 [Desulfoferula mesophila]|uniref:Uncharacterized protein n=2 Tax=Desulfoferula mesophila TaxID=3058419 RepID=A0AAU9EML3_9BACT|nr:hypothetical protein FAK_15050 [Desulfoferula mesophilus]
MIILWVQKLGLQSPLVSEDNGSFIYGYYLCDDARLLAVNYNPFWNAGAVEWEPIRSGITALYMLGRPLVWFLPLLQAYTFSTPIIFALILPWAVFFGLRWAGIGRGGALFGALLSLMPSTNWAFWMAEGATGGLLSAGLTLPALILFWRLLQDPAPQWRHISLLVVFFSLALMWLPFVFAAGVPAAVIILLHWRDMQPRRLVKVGATIALIAGVNAVWLISFLQNFPVGDFTGHTMQPWTQSLWAQFLHPFEVLLSEVNPLILVLGAIGLPLLQPGRRRDLLVFLALVLLVIILLDNMLPNYQLIRLHQYVATLLILPAALFWERLWTAQPKAWARRALVSGLIPVLALQIVATGLFFDIRVGSRMPSVAPWSSLALAGWIGRQEAPAGRVLLVGNTQKQYHGSAAYLQMLSNRPMIADFYICTLQRKLEVNLPANLCLSPPSKDDFRELIELYNVGQVVNYLGQKSWDRFLSGLPYLRLRQVIDEKFAIYETALKPGFFATGQGGVVEEFNRLKVTPAGKGRLVLKYNYSKGLSATHGVRLSPVRVWPGVDFIAADGHDGQPFEINF